MLLLVLFQKFWMFLGKVLHKRRYNFPSVYSVAAIPENSTTYIKVKQEIFGVYLLKEVTLITFSFTKCYLCNTQKTLTQISSSPSGDYPAFGCCCSGRALEGHLVPLLPPAFSVPAYPSLLPFQFKGNFWIKEKPLCSIFLLEKLRGSWHLIILYRKPNLDYVLDALCVLGHSVLSDPWPVAHQAPLFMGLPGKNTGVCSHSLL